MARTERVDALLVARGLCESLEQAKRLIMAGEVRTGTVRIEKPGERLRPDAELAVAARPKFVGRGGFKMEGALEAFGIDPDGWTCLDVGSSTGGFTDCLLQHGAAKVHAIDVGTNQLAWKLRQDPRVVSREQFNARHLKMDDLGELVDLAVMDLSFISLTMVLPAVYGVLRAGGSVICLIKPQFELPREEVGAGGIVREDDLRRKAVEKIRRFVADTGERQWMGCVASPITGTDGNVEFLAWLR